MDFSQGKIEGEHVSQIFCINLFSLDAQMPGFDLCLLASCDHSIHTYGTFGMWGSLLAGGDVIATTGTTGKEEATTEVGWTLYFNFFPHNLIMIFYCSRLNSLFFYRRIRFTGEPPWRTGYTWMCGTKPIFKR